MITAKGREEGGGLNVSWLSVAAGLPLAGSRIGRQPGRRRKAHARSWTLAGSGSHSVWRYPAGDFGRDVLADHHATSHHQPPRLCPAASRTDTCPFRRTQCHPLPDRALLAPTMRPPTTSAGPPAGGSPLAPAAACGRWTELVRSPEPRPRGNRDERFHWPGGYDGQSSHHHHGQANTDGHLPRLKPTGAAVTAARLARRAGDARALAESLPAHGVRAVAVTIAGNAGTAKSKPSR